MEQRRRVYTLNVDINDNDSNGNIVFAT